MLKAETLTDETIRTSLPDALDVLAIEGDYTEFYPGVAKISGPEAEHQAKRNDSILRKLTKRLYDPSSRTNVNSIDNLSPANVAEDWYLSLGGLNSLNGASSALMLAASELWMQPPANRRIDPNIATRFISEVDELQHGQIPERMRSALTDKVKLAHMILAPQALLDIARIPEADHIPERIFTADLAFQVSSGLTEMLTGQSVLTAEQKQKLSDALKTKWDAKFELLSLRRLNGELSGDDYETNYTQVLAEQISDTLKAESKMTNGDLHEHYIVALMRYALNTWQGQNHYEVRAATRRQDEPKDGFVEANGLARYQIDAHVSDSTGQESDRLIQLKVSDEDYQHVYARGIIQLSRIVNTNASLIETHQEMIDGFNQMRGLIREVLTSQMYEGGDDIIRVHIARVRRDLEL